jgi:hypothetical protein
MTDARWCNFGDHPFDGARSDTLIVGKMEQVPNQFGGTTPHQAILKEICGDCAAAQGLTDSYSAPDSPYDRKKALLSETRFPDHK